jgi:2-hydroxychromene-2-carboxylate isomerase
MSGPEQPDSGMDWYFDFISPFAYLQWQRLHREHPQVAAGLKPRPVLLAGLLQHWGTVGPAEVEPKRRFTYRFVLWQARQWSIPLRFPPAHPFNPLPALRLAIAADCSSRAVTAIFDHLWRDGLAGDSLDALAPVAAALGIDDPAAAIAGEQVTAQLRRNGETAIAAGVFGVPTLVDGGESFWGVDATAMALAWHRDPDAFDDPAMKALDRLPQAARRLPS